MNKKAEVEKQLEESKKKAEVEKQLEESPLTKLQKQLARLSQLKEYGEKAENMEELVEEQMIREDKEDITDENIDSGPIAQILRQLKECKEKAEDIEKELEICEESLRNMLNIEFFEYLKYIMYSSDLKFKDILEKIQKFKMDLIKIPYLIYFTKINILKSLLIDYKNIIKMIQKEVIEEYRKRGDTQILENFEKKVTNMQILINKYEERVINIKREIYYSIFENLLRTLLFKDIIDKEVDDILAMYEEFEKHIK